MPIPIFAPVDIPLDLTFEILVSAVVVCGDVRTDVGVDVGVNMGVDMERVLALVCETADKVGVDEVVIAGATWYIVPIVQSSAQKNWVTTGSPYGEV